MAPFIGRQDGRTRSRAVVLLQQFKVKRYTLWILHGHRIGEQSLP